VTASDGGGPEPAKLTRRSVEILPYDLVWNILGGLGVLAGILLLFGNAPPVGERRTSAGD
jgi:hypothetical protein